VQFHAPSRFAVINSPQVALDVSTVDDGTVSGVSVCVSGTDNCADLAAGGEANHWTGVLALDTPANGAGYTLVATATDSDGLTATDTAGVILFSGALWVSTHGISTSSNAPRVAVDSVGRIHVVWEDDCWLYNCAVGSPPGTYPKDVFYRRFNGTSWNATRCLTSGVTGESDSLLPDVAVDHQDNVHVVWQDNGTTGPAFSGSRIVHRVIDGVTGVPGAYTAVGKQSDLGDFAPRIAASPAHQAMEVVWHRRKSSTDQDVMRAVWSGASWGTPEVISVSPAAGRSIRPDIAIDLQGNSFIVWQETLTTAETRFQVFLRVVNGAVMGTEPCVPLTAYATGTATYPAVAVGGPEDLAHVVWLYGNGTDPHLSDANDRDVYHVTYDLADTQTPLGTAVLVTPDVNDGISEFPSVAVDDSTGTAYVLWADTGNFGGGGTDGDTYRATWTSGAGMGPPVLVSNDAFDNGATGETHVVAAGTSLYMTWADSSAIPDDDDTNKPDVLLEGLSLVE
jgi:hypothetical protein